MASDAQHGKDEPAAEPLDLPAGYGKPQSQLRWADVRSRLIDAQHYWLATVRPDGRPHAVPIDGLWLEDRCYFGGSAATVKLRNLREKPNAVLHLEDAESVVVVEGACAEHFPKGARRAFVRAFAEQVRLRPRSRRVLRVRRLAAEPDARARLDVLSP